MRVWVVLVGAAACAGLAFGGWHKDAGSKTQRTFWRQGTVKSEYAMRGDEREGESRTWYANGQLESQGAYRAGSRHGAWSFWNSDGSLDPARSGTYALGSLIEVQRQSLADQTR